MGLFGNMHGNSPIVALPFWVSCYLVPQIRYALYTRLILWKILKFRG